MWKLSSFAALMLLIVLAPSAYSQNAPSQNVLAYDGQRATLNLNGEWQSRPHSSVQFDYPPPADGWTPETVPHEKARNIDSAGGHYMMPLKDYLNADGTAFKSDKLASWFRRSFTIPAAALTGKRAVLHLHGVAFKSNVWLNGKKLGTSLLGQVPSEYDVTGILRGGSANDLVIGVTGREGVIDIQNKTYLAPASGTAAGIWGDVQIRLLPQVYIDDVFIQTSVNKKQISLQMTVANDSKAAATLRPEATIVDAAGTPQLNVAGEALALPAGTRKTITLTKPWLPARLWTHETPTLYYAQSALRQGDKISDRRTDRFGFREFEIRGTDFYLNGVRTTLLRNSMLSGLGQSREQATRTIREQIASNYNSARLHLGFNTETLLDAADEMGLMMVPESSWHNIGNKMDVEKAALWLPQVTDYTRRLVKLHRNRPSVVIWSLANENLWGDTDAARMRVADAVVAAAREADPTRPLQGDGETNWGGRLQVTNIHYPESTVGPLRKEFPNSGIIEPNDIYWLKREGTNVGWRAEFAWDRPLVMGEYWWTTGSLDDRTSFMGESAYDWEKWRWQSFGDLEARGDNEYSLLLQRITDVYRLQGVAGLNPWSGNREHVLNPVAVRALEFHPSYFGGTQAKRRFVIFNDSGSSYDSMHLQCRLTVEGRTVWQSTVRQFVPPSEHRVVEVPIDFPAVSQRQNAVLSVRLRMQRGGGNHELNRHEEQLFIMPAARWGSRETSGILLLDPKGQTSTAFKQIGLNLAPKSTLTATDLSDVKTLIIGKGTDASSYRAVTEAFLRAGGNVLVLQQENSAPVLPELTESDDKHVTTRSWKRVYNHPVTAPFDDRQFSYWQPDNLVATRTLNKPASGDNRILLDSGGLYGLRWSPLVETIVGKGRVVQSQLNLLDRLDKEPVAGHLLIGLIEYCRTAQPKPVAPMRLLAGANEPLRQALTAASVVTRAGLEGDGPVLLDASYTPSADEITRLRTYVQNGGNLWLHGFTPATIERIAALVPFKPELAEIDKTVHAAARRSDDPWMNNLSSFDFHWTKIDIGARADYFGDSQPTAKLGQYALRLPSVEAGTVLIDPGLMVRIPSGKGAILFDTLPWEGALGGESDKVVRIVTSLSSHLGAAIQVAPEQSYSYFPVDLTKQANRHYFDPVAGDGKGGWTDQGPNDMRYFLINHTGLAGGMEVGVGEFPSSVNLAGRPFSPIDPKKNGGRAAVILRGKDHDLASPAEVKGIAVGKKADKLWFLQNAGWVSNVVGEEIARYIIHYDDGTQVVFPVRNKIEVGEWWSPGPLTGAKVAWTGKNDMQSPVGLYSTEWANPHPAKTIVSIDLIGALSSGQLALVAITGGTETSGGAQAYRPIAHWVLGDFKDGVVPNRVKGGGALSVGKSSPEAVTAAGGTALRFRGGQSLTGETKQTPGIHGDKPWGVRVTCTVEAKPDGYQGGIYQAMNYGKSGMRLVLGSDLRPSVEIYPADEKPRYIRGGTELSLGRPYTLEVRFDGARAYMYINSKIDGSVESPLPAPYSGPIQVGQSSGKDYNFNGLISEIQVFSIGD